MLITYRRTMLSFVSSQLIIRLESKIQLDAVKLNLDESTTNLQKMHFYYYVFGRGERGLAYTKEHVIHPT